jgi:hypothetical protein
MLKMQSCVDFIDKSYEILGNALKPKMDCEFEPYRACVLGVIGPTPTRHALSNKRRAG